MPSFESLAIRFKSLAIVTATAFLSSQAHSLFHARFIMPGLANVPRDEIWDMGWGEHLQVPPAEELRLDHPARVPHYFMESNPGPNNTWYRPGDDTTTLAGYKLQLLRLFPKCDKRPATGEYDFQSAKNRTRWRALYNQNWDRIYLRERVSQRRVGFILGGGSGPENGWNRAVFLDWNGHRGNYPPSGPVHSNGARKLRLLAMPADGDGFPASQYAFDRAPITEPPVPASEAFALSWEITDWTSVTFTGGYAVRPTPSGDEVVLQPYRRMWWHMMKDLSAFTIPIDEDMLDYDVRPGDAVINAQDNPWADY